MMIDIGAQRGVSVIPMYSKDGTAFFDKSKNKELKEKIKSELKAYNFEGKKEETLFLKIGNNKVLLIGINKAYSLEDLRRSYSVVYKMLKARKEKEATIEVPKEDEKEIKAMIEGLDLSDYKFDKYITKKEEKEVELHVFLDVSHKFARLLQETLLVNKNVKIVRDLVNDNSYSKTPQILTEIVSDFAKKNNLKAKVLDEKDIQKEKLNLLWAVGQGSQYPPRLIIAEYNGNPNSKEKIALIGKGINFDTGGVNLKQMMLDEMRMDMAGAAVVFGAFKTAVELKLKKNLILVIPAAENALSGRSYKPGDIFVSYSGISVEIGNTDAEGRLVLADAIGYVQKNYKPTAIIDVATLTGAVMVALGPSLIGMFGNNEQQKKVLFKAGEETFERVWELPIYDEHRDLNKGKFADIKNIGGKDGGSITAAAFLEKFIQEGVNWTHLDIAGAASNKKESYYIPEFGTGRVVRLLTEYLKQ